MIKLLRHAGTDHSRSQPSGITHIKPQWRNILTLYADEAFQSGYYPDEDFVSILHELGELMICPPIPSGARVASWIETSPNIKAQLIRRFQTEPLFDLWLRIVTLFLNCIERRNWAHQTPYFSRLNTDLQSHGFLYEYHEIRHESETGYFLAIQSDYVFESITKPSLELLRHSDFASARSEFESAVSFFLQGPDRYSDCITNAVKAFESVMKVVLAKNNALPNANLPAAKLVKAIIDAGLIDTSFSSQSEATIALLNQLSTILSSGAVMVRNRLGAHGAGTRTAPPVKILVEFTLHQVAALMLFIGRSAGYA
jgi:hypothetical protein